MEELERALQLKQLQINRLLNITQAINSNAPAERLYEMYRSLLQHEMDVKRMCLFVRSEDRWIKAAAVNTPQSLIPVNVEELLSRFKKMSHVGDNPSSFLQHFDLVIPVLHKETAIAYVFLGGFSEEDDLYNKIQFITTITNVVSVAIENKRLFKRQLEQERLKNEMHLAAEVQQKLVPKILPKTETYEFDAIYKPHLSVGGDYFDYIEFDDGKIFFCIGDFTGKGVPAALLMANFQANFHTLINQQRADLETFVRSLNQSVNLITRGERFITFFVAEYDTYSRRLRYVNAGHNPPVLVTGNELYLLKEGCIMLGSFQELPKVEVGSKQIEKEAIVFSYTDGLTDIRNEKDQFLKEDQLYQFVEANYQLRVEAFNRQLMEFIDNFKGRASYPDDFTVFTGKLYCPSNPQKIDQATP